MQQGVFAQRNNFVSYIFKLISVIRQLSSETS